MQVAYKHEYKIEYLTRFQNVTLVVSISILSSGGDDIDEIRKVNSTILNRW